LEKTSLEAKKQLKALGNKKKHEGIATRTEIRMLDKAFRAYKEEGLASFMAGYFDPKEPLQRSCRLVLDKASTSGAGFLERYLLMCIFFDPWHEIWNDGQNGLKHAKVWGRALSY